MLALLEVVMSTKEQSIAPKATVFGPPAQVSTYVTMITREFSRTGRLGRFRTFCLVVQESKADLRNRSLQRRCKKL